MTGLCGCSHNQLSHQVEKAPGCVHCGCEGFQTIRSGQRPQPVEAGRDWNALLAEARDIGAPKCASLADRIEAQLEQLRERIAAEHAREAERRRLAAEQQAARARVKQLEGELRDARRKARGVVHAARVAKVVKDEATGHFQCPDCPEWKATPQGLGAHRAKKHGYRRAAA